MRGGNYESSSPAANGNVSPVESPGNNGCWNSSCLTGERYSRPPCCLNRLFWWACYRRRGCKRTETCYPHNIHMAGIWRFSKAHERLTVTGVKFSQKQMCEKSLVSNILATGHKREPKNRDRTETYCSRTHQSGQGNRALHHTGN